MNALPPEELLWESRRAGVGADDDAMPSDELLESYRAGSLSDIGARRLEWTLCRSAAARARMAELAGAPFARPRRRLRRKILGRPSPAEASGARYWPLAAAVLLAGAMISGAILLDSDPVSPTVKPLPPELAFDVQVEGLAATRSGSGLAQAFPETPVRITVEPRREGLDGLEFAVYTEREGRLRRLEPGDDLRAEPQRGAALLVATARSLVGADPGTHEFFVVVARAGALPRDLEREAASAAELARELLVYRQALTILVPHDTPPIPVER